jgi:hypothetical protein
MGGLCQLRMCALLHIVITDKLGESSIGPALLQCCAVLQVAFLSFSVFPVSHRLLLTLLTYARNKRHASHINEKESSSFLLLFPRYREREAP